MYLSQSTMSLITTHLGFIQFKVMNTGFQVLHTYPATPIRHNTVVTTNLQDIKGVIASVKYHYFNDGRLLQIYGCECSRKMQDFNVF